MSRTIFVPRRKRGLVHAQFGDVVTMLARRQLLRVSIGESFSSSNKPQVATPCHLLTLLLENSRSTFRLMTALPEPSSCATKCARRLGRHSTILANSASNACSWSPAMWQPPPNLSRINSESTKCMPNVCPVAKFASSQACGPAPSSWLVTASTMLPCSSPPSGSFRHFSVRGTKKSSTWWQFSAPSAQSVHDLIEAGHHRHLHRRHTVITAPTLTGTGQMTDLPHGFVILSLGEGGRPR